MSSNVITVKTREEGFSITARYNPNGKEGAYFFNGHIEEHVSLESAFGIIRDALGDIASLAERRGSNEKTAA
jgi:hypothetical protein